jgi:AcrR family transcriptional regulator
MTPPLSRTTAVTRPPRGEPSEQREAILAAALTLLRRDGERGLRVRAVAAAAGCSTTGVYTWFGGKHGLIEAIYVQGFEAFETELRTVSPGPSPLAHVKALALRYRAWAVTDPTHYEVMFGSLVPGFVPSPEAGAFALTTFEILVDAVRAAMDSGELRPGDPVQLAFHVWASIHGYVELELAGQTSMNSLPSDQLYERGLDLLLDGLVTRQAATASTTRPKKPTTATRRS